MLNLPNFGVVVVDKEGNTVTTDARDDVVEDPAGQKFPWRSPTFTESMPQRLVRGDGTEVQPSMSGKVWG